MGITLEIVGVAGLGLLLRPDSTWLVTTPLLFVYGIGVGFPTAQLTGAVLTDVPVERSGQGSGTQSTSRQVGSALGVAILGTVLFTSLGSRLDTALTDLGTPAAQRLQLVDAVKGSAGAAIPGLAANPVTAPAANAARTAFTDATRLAALTAAGFLVIGLGASLSLGSARRQDDELRKDPEPTSSGPPGPA